jgi:hypothetical protein
MLDVTPLAILNALLGLDVLALRLGRDSRRFELRDGQIPSP